MQIRYKIAPYPETPTGLNPDEDDDVYYETFLDAENELIRHILTREAEHRKRPSQITGNPPENVYQIKKLYIEEGPGGLQANL